MGRAATVAEIGDPSEHASQCAVIDWWALARHKWKLPEFALFAVPNGAVLAGDARHRAIQMNNLKRSGLRVGALDLILAQPRQDAHGLFVEMKRRPNKPTPEQLETMGYLRGAGYDCCICYSSDEAIRAITGYLGA